MNKYLLIVTEVEGTWRVHVFDQSDSSPHGDPTGTDVFSSSMIEVAMAKAQAWCRRRAEDAEDRMIEVEVEK